MDEPTYHTLNQKGPGADPNDVAIVLAVLETNRRKLESQQELDDPELVLSLTSHYRQVLNTVIKCAWDERQLDLAVVSNIWPETIFSLDIYGQDGTQRSREYYQQGRVQEIRLDPEHPGFDPSQLKDPRDLSEHQPTAYKRQEGPK